MLPSDLLLRRQTDFAFWRPRLGGKPPVLVIGTFAAGNPNTIVNRKDIPLSTAGPQTPRLWAIAPAATGPPAALYHYSLQLSDTKPLYPPPPLPPLPSPSPTPHPR